MSLERRRRLVELAREQELLVLEDNPYGLLRYEGEPLPTLRSLDGGDLVIYLGHLLEDPLARPAASAGRSAPRPVLAKMNLGKQAADLCSSSTTQHFVAAYFETGGWPEYIAGLRELYRRRRDVMLDALSEHFPAQATLDPPPGRPVHLGDAARPTSTRPTCWPCALDEKVAFVPGAAAYIDGRGGSSMRLNFSGVSEDQIREGIRRIGKTIASQVALYGALSGEPPQLGVRPPARGVLSPAAPQPEPAPREPDAELADVLELPRRGGRDARHQTGQKRRG